MKKSVKQILLAVLTAIVMLSLAGCGSGDKTITVDVAKLARELADSTVTSDTLSEAQSSMLSTIYFITEDQLASGAAYMSSGSTACEVAVIECRETSQTKDVEQLFQTRVKNQSDLYASYNADQVSKLDKAIIKSAGKYVVLVVCDDTDKAEEILKSYGF